MKDIGEGLEESQNDSKSKLIWIWVLIILGSAFDYGFEQVKCINGFPDQCSGIDFTNLIFGTLAGIIIIFNKDTLVTDDDSKLSSKWGVRSAIAACILLFLTAFDGVGCFCP